MQKFLEAIDPHMTADSVRKLIGRYDLIEVKRGDPSDEGFLANILRNPRSTESGSNFARPTWQGLCPIFGAGLGLSFSGTACSWDHFPIVSAAVQPGQCRVSH